MERRPGKDKGQSVLTQRGKWGKEKNEGKGECSSDDEKSANGKRNKTQKMRGRK